MTLPEKRRDAECCCFIDGCDIPLDCLVLKWTNYDAGIHGGSDVVTYVRKPTQEWKDQSGTYNPTDCVWLDADTGTYYVLESSGGSSTITDDFGDTWSWDSGTDPYFVLGSYLHDTDFTGDYDITVEQGDCVMAPL